MARKLIKPEITGANWQALEQRSVIAGDNLICRCYTSIEDTKYIAASPKAWEWLEKRWDALGQRIENMTSRELPLLDKIVISGFRKELSELDEILLSAGYKIENV